MSGSLHSDEGTWYSGQLRVTIVDNKILWLAFNFGALFYPWTPYGLPIGASEADRTSGHH